MKILALLLGVVLLGLVAFRLFAGFWSQSPAAYSGTKPQLDIRRALGGAMISEGVIFGPTGKMATRFEATMHGTWDGANGILKEEFRYDSGKTQSRQWAITLGENGKFQATAPDIIGIAEGEVSGATIRMRYRLVLTPEAGGHVLDVVDWLYLMEDGSIMNRSEMRKFGLTVAELIATIRPAGE